MDGFLKEPITGTPLPEVSEQIGELLRTPQDVADLIERLLAILDSVTGDPDLEPAGDEQDEDRDDEPGLGWTDGEAAYGVQPFGADIDAELDDADTEPSLAAPESVRTPLGPDYPDWYPAGLRRSLEGRQHRWAAGGHPDLEGDRHEDDELGGDDEPSLGVGEVYLGRGMFTNDNGLDGQYAVVDAGMDQRDWHSSGDDDREGEFDGREDGADNEPDADTEPDVDDEDGNDVEGSGLVGEGALSSTPSIVNVTELDGSTFRWPPIGLIIMGPDGKPYRAESI